MISFKNNINSTENILRYSDEVNKNKDINFYSLDNISKNDKKIYKIPLKIIDNNISLNININNENKKTKKTKSTEKRAKRENKLDNKISLANKLSNNGNNINSDLINFGFNKKKKIYKIKKSDNKILSFIDENNNLKEFKLYKDSDLGFGKEYKIKNLFQDNDVNSDEENIKLGVRKSLLNLSESIKLLKNKNEEYTKKYLECFGKL